MKIRFAVDQAEAFRQGIDCPKSIVTIEINPSELESETRELLADRMQGIDVLELFYDDGELVKGQPFRELLAVPAEPRRIFASAPTFEALMDAVQWNESVVHSIKSRFNCPVQLHTLKEPPMNENAFHPVKWTKNDFTEDVRPWLERGHRVVFQCFIEEMQTKLNELINAKSYVVSILPIPGSTAQGRFYCERVFAAPFSGSEVVAHTPAIVYNEKAHRVVEAFHLFHALAIYNGSPTPGRDLNDFHILRWQWESGKWVIVQPEGLIDMANKLGEAA